MGNSFKTFKNMKWGFGKLKNPNLETFKDVEILKLKHIAT